MKVIIEHNGQTYTGYLKSADSSPAIHHDGPVFPPYGKQKGQPVKGASLETLQYYKTGSERTLADPSKERFHEKERAFLAILDAEIAAQTGGGTNPDIPF